MQQTLTSSMITALLSAVFYGCAKNIYGVSPGWVTLKTVLIWCGIIFGIYAVIGGCLIVADNLRSHWYALGDVMERLMHPDIALVTAIGKLNNPQLEALLYEVGDYVLTTEPGWKIEGKDGRLVKSDIFSQYLYLCENHVPNTELPAVSRNAPGSTVRADEEAIISFLRARKLVRYRSGERYEWIKSPETVRELYF